MFGAVSNARGVSRVFPRSHRELDEQLTGLTAQPRLNECNVGVPKKIRPDVHLDMAPVRQRRPDGTKVSSEVLVLCGKDEDQPEICSSHLDGLLFHIQDFNSLSSTMTGDAEIPSRRGRPSRSCQTGRTLFQSPYVMNMWCTDKVRAVRPCGDSPSSCMLPPGETGERTSSLRLGPNPRAVMLRGHGQLAFERKLTPAGPLAPYWLFRLSGGVVPVLVAGRGRPVDPVPPGARPIGRPPRCTPRRSWRRRSAC